MTRWADSGNIKIERAYKHIVDLVTEISAFVERNPYRIVPEKNIEAGECLYRLSVREQPPLYLGAIAGDAFHNLRSTLDILWRQVRYPNGGGERSKDQFPIVGSRDEFQSRFGKERPEKPRVETVRQILCEIKPYPGGNDWLWMLEVANNKDKHRILLPAYTKLCTVEYNPSPYIVPGYGLPPIYLRINYEGAEDAVYDGAILHRAVILDPTHTEDEARPAVEVGFGDCEGIKGKPMLSTLGSIAQEVKRVVESFLIAGLIS